MLERIIIGMLIGIFAGVSITKKFNITEKKRSIIMGFLALIIIAFVGSSFMFGAVYGVMAVGEVAIGYWLSSSLITHKST